jgi:hypothetical protein
MSLLSPDVLLLFFNVDRCHSLSPVRCRLTDVTAGRIGTADVAQWAVVIVVALIDTRVAPVLIVGTGWSGSYMTHS